MWTAGEPHAAQIGTVCGLDRVSHCFRAAFVGSRAAAESAAVGGHSFANWFSGGVPFALARSVRGLRALSPSGFCADREPVESPLIVPPRSCRCRGAWHGKESPSHAGSAYCAGRRSARRRGCPARRALAATRAKPPAAAWSLGELARRVGCKDAAVMAVVSLQAVGLVGRAGEFVFATRAAARFGQLLRVNAARAQGQSKRASQQRAGARGTTNPEPGSQPPLPFKAHRRHLCWLDRNRERRHRLLLQSCLTGRPSKLT
jgi:hypothetical protein